MFGLNVMRLECVRDWIGGLRAGLRVYVEGGSAARVGRRRGKASEEGGEAGEAGVCIAACVFLASLRPAVCLSVDPEACVSPHCESVYL